MTQKVAISALSDSENATVNRLLGQLDAKHERNALRASYYDGKRAIRQVGSVIPPQYYRLGIALGWSAKAVDVLARRCNLDAFVWAGGDLDSLGMAELWDANYMRTEVSSAVVSSMIHGVSFLVTTRGGIGEPPALVHVKDAMNATGEWDSRVRSLRNLLSINSRDDRGDVDGFTLYLPDLTITAVKDRSGWTVGRSEHAWGVPVDVLVHKPRVGREFGASRLSRPVMSAQDRALRQIIRMEGHSDVYSYPEMWMLGADETIFKDASGNMKPVWQTMLGRIKGIPDDQDATDPKLARADVKQFPASSPQPHIDLYKQIAAQFAGETDLPITALGVQAETNTTTADGSDNAERQLIAEAEGVTDDYSTPLRRTAARMLAMANGLSEMPDDWRSIDTRWRDPRYLSRAAQADAGMKMISVAPWLAETEVGLRALGLSSQDIALAMAEKRRAQNRSVLGALTGADEG